MSEGTLHIEITGDKDSGKTVVANIIHDALEKHGFSTVAQVDETGEPTARYPETQTILDLVRHDKPQLFDTPITISETTWAGSGFIGGDEDTLERLESEANNAALADVS